MRLVWPFSVNDTFEVGTCYIVTCEASVDAICALVFISNGEDK